MKEFEVADNRSLVAKIAEKKSSICDYMPPKTLGRPKGKLAMDACIKNVLSGFTKEISGSGVPQFLGYSLLSTISQEALIRAGVETIADEATRKFVEFEFDDETGETHESELNEIEKEFERFGIREKFNDAFQKDGYFGGCLVYIDVGELSDEEKQEPLVLDEKTFSKGMLRGFKVIEPVNIYPAEYNTSDPTDEHYFNPEAWYILGKKYHASRFLYICSNPTALLLKPAYNFFGIPRAQMALDYVAHFVENRESAQELLNKFSLTCWQTDLSQMLQGGECNDLIKRVRMFNRLKDNQRTLVFDKEMEDVKQINTPLGGVTEIVNMSLNLLTAVWRIPKIKYIGEGEGGLNASSREQMRSYYDFILGYKEKTAKEPLNKIIKIIQLNLGKKPNESIKIKFPVLWELDDVEKAQMNKTQADRDALYIANGVLSQEEVRKRLSIDKNSEYTMIDVDELPEVTDEPLKDLKDDVTDEEERIASDMALDGRWITIGARKKGENGEDDEGRKGRHIYLDDGETPEEAIEELKDKDKKTEKSEKEDKSEKSDNQETKQPDEKSEEKKEEKEPASSDVVERYEKLKSELKRVEKQISMSSSNLKEIYEKKAVDLGKEIYEIEQKYDVERGEQEIRKQLLKNLNDFSNAYKNFIPSKTIKEAENVASIIKKDGDVKFPKDANIKTIDAMNKAVLNMLSKYSDGEKIDTYGYTNRGKFLAHAGARTVEIQGRFAKNTDNEIREIFEKSEYGKFAQKRADEAMEQAKQKEKEGKEYAANMFKRKADFYQKQANSKFKRWTVQTSADNFVRDTFYHEFGHTIMYRKMKEEARIALKNNEKSGELSIYELNRLATGKGSKTEKVINEAYRKAKRNGDIYDISEYAASNYSEFFAEVFAMREANKKLPEYIETMLKEVCGK